MWKSLAAFGRDFSKQLVEIRAFCGFPQMRHFHQAMQDSSYTLPDIRRMTRTTTYGGHPLKSRNNQLLFCDL
jgi:hypothetical protein